MQMTKKFVFWASLMMTLVFLLLAWSQSTFCYNMGWCNRLWETINFAGLFLYIFPPVFLFSLITYRAKDEVFRAWFYFVCGWVPLSIVLILLASGGSGGGFGIPTILDQEFIAIILAALFAVISLIIIALKYLSMRPDW